MNKKYLNKPHAVRYANAAGSIARDSKKEGTSREAAVYMGMLVSTQAALDHPDEAKAALDELNMPLGIREELVRNASILAKGRTGTRPPGFSRKTKH